MPSPFPGMNPYLENPNIWPGFHNFFIAIIAQTINPLLRPKYFASIEERVYQTTEQDSVLICLPDLSIIEKQPTVKKPSSSLAVADPLTEPISVSIPLLESVKECYLVVKSVQDFAVITAIELLSLKNKRKGIWRDTYLKKRDKIFSSLTHFIEIDLLRQGESMPTSATNLSTDYRILISRSQTRPQADLYAFNLPDTIPSIAVPLRAEDPELIINLQELLNQTYDLGSYDLRLDYQQSFPGAKPEDMVWVKQILQSQETAEIN